MRTLPPSTLDASAPSLCSHAPPNPPISLRLTTPQVRMYEQKISKRFGKTLVVPQATFEAAKATLKTIEAGQRKGGVAVLFTLLKPQLPLYGLSLLLMAFDSAVRRRPWSLDPST